MIDYKVNEEISSDQFVELLRRSTLAERRPVDDMDTIRGMLEHADLLVTAWQNEQLVGLARSVTDFSYCCYLSDLAVDVNVQGQGIGRELISQTREQLGPKCKLILLSAPAAVAYYPHIGFRQHVSAWIMNPEDKLG